jgi:hypothetical protein
MKGNIKKLVLLVIITVIAPFIFAATVTADQRFPHAIRGQYAATGGGTCIAAFCGFGSDYVPNGAAQGAWADQSFSQEAVFTFEHDGTGTVSETNRYVNHVQIPQSPWPSAGLQTVTYSFAYTVDHDGKINITGDPATFIATWISGPSKGRIGRGRSVSRAGTISPDGKTIILNGGLPTVETLSPPVVPQCPTPQLICNTSAVLIWQHDVKDQ